MLYINNWSIKMLKQKFPNYKVTSYCPSGSWQTSRYIQIYIDNGEISEDGSLAE